ncbi:hypothetical protein DNL40_10710 [Xylanimonas oleitrophica]|uniref:DUF305 domain-containing protein n=1 Tax=Xylanimonas oleitrophica TaxID=2607479 RepID=A0A2W5WWB7_9MICO|nr:hypothetical protein [Xylanimonas oleitrophica]PZR52586.1 hypothetical protein DNL40_10710 [Xylanimonas oleitrophica]
MLLTRRAPGHRPAVVTALVLGAALLAGCGADQAEPSASPAPAASAVTVPSDAVVSDAEGAVAGGQAPADDAQAAEDAVDATQAQAEAAQEAETSSAEDPQPADDAGPATCAELQAAWSQTNKALVNLSPDHPRALVTSFRSAGRAMEPVEAPDDVADAWRSMSAYLGRVNDALADVDADDTDAVSAAMAREISARDTARATQAAEEITAFVADGCRS